MQIFAESRFRHFHYTVQEDEWHLLWAKQGIPETVKGYASRESLTTQM